MLKITYSEKMFLIKKWRLMTSKKVDLMPPDPFKKQYLIAKLSLVC